MSNRKPEGMLMSPSNKSGSGPTKRRSKPPTGSMHPTSGGGGGAGTTDRVDLSKIEPMEVVFKAEAFRKLIIWTFGPTLLTLIGALSAFFYFYHRTNLHIADPAIHLTRGERGKLETKEEATKERKKLKKEITDHFDVKVREIRVEQNEQVKEIGKKLEKDQKSRLNKVLHEVIKTRRDIKNHE